MKPKYAALLGLTLILNACEAKPTEIPSVLLLPDKVDSQLESVEALAELPPETEEAPHEPSYEPLPRLAEAISCGIFTTDIADTRVQDELNALSAELKGLDLAVWFEDLTGGGYFYSNPDVRWYYQSVTKAFYVHRLYQILPESELAEISELIERTIVDSDMTAYDTLFERYAIEDFNRYARGEGSGLSLKWGRFSGGKISDAAALMRDIYENRGSSAKELLELMKNTTFNSLIPAGADGLEVAHKYGYGGDGLGFNDAAIVYAKRPFMLVIMSNLPATTSDFAEPFVKITETCVRLAELDLFTE